MRKVVGLIGGSDQVSRSLSPVIHNAAFEALGMDWVYLPFPVERNRVKEAVRGLVAAGVKGLNVTMPHKLEAAAAVDRLDGAAQITGAINTVEVRSTGLIGHNTDGAGFVRFLEKDLGVPLAGASVLVIGGGGVARSIIAAAAEAGASMLSVLVRVHVKAGMKADNLRPLAGRAGFRIGDIASADEFVSGSDIIVNATPVGQRGEPSLIQVQAIRSNAAVVDLVYSPPATRLVTEARKRGITASGGLGMLLHQGALSFEIWTGQEPPMEVMSAAALRSLKSELRPAD